MPPAAADDFNRQYSRSLEDDTPFNTDLARPPQEHEPSGKSKKKKNKKAKAAKAVTESPSEDLLPTPAAAPVEPSSCPDPTLDHDVRPTVASPMLDALGSIDGTPENDVVTRTDTWAQAVPYGKSPPTDLMDGDLPQESPVNFPTIQERGGFSSQPSSASPPTRIRPFSYGSGYRSSIQSRQQSVDRRKSQSYGSPMGNLAPPPHMPQAHFYGAPDIDLGTQPRPPSDCAYSYCGFDTLPSFAVKSPRAGINVLVVGSDATVEVHAIEDRRARLVGLITGLGGRVLEAKILAGQSSNDSNVASQPHIAITTHGPIPPNEEEALGSPAGSDIHEVPSSMVRGRSGDRRLDTPFYQTKVQVFSLRSGALLATLFASKPVPSLDNIPGQPSFAPSPVGSLRLFATGSHVIIASGISGEVYVFRQTSADTYQCLGKTWTNVHAGEARRYSTSSSSTDPDGSHNDSLRTAALERPIVAVQGRWLAIVPPSTSYRGSVQGFVPPNIIHEKAQGLETRSPPSMSSVNCATDVGEGESFLNKVARGVTQELVKGARWMGDQGLQAWNNYWNSQQPPGMPPPPRPSRTPEIPSQGYGVFPPTHAQDTQISSSPEPDAVSIIDLKRFDDGMDSRTASLNPVATFQVPNGCSFLSLSPNGLMLFTGSKKGDVQYVWDLMQLKHCRAMAFMTDDHTAHSPNVRQVARYARLTTSSIVDVIWTPPIGDKLAIITRKGTVHVFDLLQSAFQWPPFRRARSVVQRSPALGPASDDMSSQTNPSNPLSAAMKLVGGKTQPFFSAVRGRVPSSGASFPNMSGFALSSAASIKGGKVVAAGLGKSMGAAATGTVHTLRHVGENRLHLAGLAHDPAPSRVMWICGKGLISLGVIDEGVFKLYRLKKGPSGHKTRQSHSVIGGKESQFKLPAKLQNSCGSAPVLKYDPDLVVQASLLLPSANSQAPSTTKPFCQPLSQAEIETNTPYQPFHTDQRVGLHVFQMGNNSSVSTGQWVFGDDIPTTKVHVRSYSNSGDDNADDEDDNAAIHGHSLGAGGDMENLITLGNSTGNMEEVLITTRRKKRHSAPLKADDGFFEDDCEVLDFARDRV
ncbi:hypothetical protein N7532_010893 [Penicillium argentinense]|uniref:Uncharacterized protein n=1 Tax=Penicillium argentinense TaxID=1131581 RepID=A0A9W9EQF8_9EURO|nr:uncharacterized protein N7532_010893 [Penicillium argentinense]KAJ5086122.1 hypothetical protein N7532_010893 [Penicillium argentinense]